MEQWGEQRPRGVAAYDFYAGIDTRAYECFGVHREADGGYRFRLYAPGSGEVVLCGDFLPCGCIPMQAADERGVWEVLVHPDISPLGMRYCYSVDGTPISDPYARRGLWQGEVGSVVAHGSDYRWQDAAWMAARAEAGGAEDRPIQIYYVHLSSFATRQGRSCAMGDAYLSYRELGALLAPYAADMGYTHVRLMPLCEQAERGASLSYFAPTSRHGAADGLREMIDLLHRHGVGVWMDFPIGGAGDVYDLCHASAQSFFLSAALFWLREFHLDGLCLSGLPCGEAGEVYASALAAAVRSECPGVLLWSDAVGGVGDLTEHPRFAHDLTELFATDPVRRGYLFDRLALTVQDVLLTRPRPVLALPPRGARGEYLSQLRLLWGGYSERFAALRLVLAYQVLHPGKKQVFMGTELGQPRALDGSIPPDWFLRELETHAATRRYVRALNHLYRDEPCLWEGEESAVLVPAVGETVLVLMRSDRTGRRLFGLINVMDSEASTVLPAGEGVPSLRIILHSDEMRFGGQGRVKVGAVFPSSGGVTIPPLTAIFCEPEGQGRPVHSFLLPPCK